MNIVFVAHSSFHDNFVVGSHHLARGLAARGHDVWHIGPPVTPFHFARYHYPAVRRRLHRALLPPVRTGSLTTMEPFSLVPWQVARLLSRRGNAFVTCSNLAGRLRRAFGPGGIDLLIIDDPRFAGLDRQVQPRATIYRPTDFYVEMKGDPALVDAERRVLAGATAVVATSQPVLEHALTLHPGLPSLLLENGFDHEHFSLRTEPEPASLRDIPHPRVVYVGALDFRFDHGLIHRLGRRMPDVHFVLIGEGSVVTLIAAHPLPNVHLLGPRLYRDLPAYLQHGDVGMLPLNDSRANIGRSPMKLYEYAGAGLPVLARRTTELARRGEPHVSFYTTDDEAVQALEKILAHAPDRTAIANACKTQSWTRKVDALLQFIACWCQPGKGE